MMTEWNIQSRSTACQACQKPFADKEPFHTLLYDEKGGYLRFDVCDSCWQTQYSQGSGHRKGFVSHWQGVFQVPPPPAPEAIRAENAETLLKKLVEANDERHVAARYILAVMLERKRVLKVKDQLKQDGGRCFIYEHTGNGDAYTIRDPLLQLHQLEVVQREVSDLLEHGISGAPAPTPAVSDSSDAPGEPEAGPSNS
jgi:hypothetical protein